MPSHRRHNRIDAAGCTHGSADLSAADHDVGKCTAAACLHSGGIAMPSHRRHNRIDAAGCTHGSADLNAVGHDPDERTAAVLLYSGSIAMPSHRRHYNLNPTHSSSSSPAGCALRNSGECVASRQRHGVNALKLSHAAHNRGHNTCRHCCSDAVIILGTRLLPTTQARHGVHACHCNTSVAVHARQHRRCRRHGHRPAKHLTVRDIATVAT
jgi:hypothetical protein